jgi:hypothetical protein
MANVYFSSSLNRQGALRAVLSSKEGVSLLEKSSNSYAGHNFPTEFNGRPEFAILRVFDGEANKEWRSGYYLFDQDIIQVEEAPDGPWNDCHSQNRNLACIRHELLG